MHDYQLVFSILFLVISLVSVKLIQDLLNQLADFHLGKRRSASVSQSTAGHQNPVAGIRR